jgi:predicted O-methyltransferase YrrM
MNTIDAATISYPGRLYAEEILTRGWVSDRQGERKTIRGPVSADEARFLAGLILETNAKRCLETGVALGVSTLAITQAVSQMGGQHQGIDPFQMSEHGGAAVATLEEFGLGEFFSLHEGPSHSEMPKLFKSGECFDLIFIDGAHQFGLKFIDFYYADLLSKIGGCLVFHDLLLPATKKLYKYLQTLHRYEYMATPQLQPSLARKLRYLGGAFVKFKPLRTYWPNGFGNLLVLRKISDKPAPWNLFRNF